MKRLNISLGVTHFIQRALLFLVLATLCISSRAQEQADTEISQAELQDRLRVKLRTVQHLALNPVMVRAVRTQNSTGLTLDEIKQRDVAWTESDAITPLKRELQNNNPGRFLKQTVETNPAFSEAFLTDNQGANVAAFPVTSDYWQGDEEKWTASYNEGEGKIFVGPIEFDESSGTYQAQVSAPVMNRGETIGVLVVGVNLSYIKKSN